MLQVLCKGAAADLFAKVHDQAHAPPAPGAGLPPLGELAPDALALARQIAGTEDKHRQYMKFAAGFKVVDQHRPGDPPNALTENEVRQMFALYQDIDHGRGDLTIDTSEIADKDEASHVHDEYMTNVARILQTQSGRELLTKLSNNVHEVDGQQVHRKTAMRALHLDGHLDNDPTNDLLNPLVSGDGQEHPKDRENSGYHFEYGEQVRGKGSDSEVYFTPYGKMPEGPEGIYRPDVVIFHELVHSLHTTAGDNDHTRVQAGEGVPEDAACKDGIGHHEHQAVGIGRYAGDRMTEDAYRRERKLLGQAHAPGALPDDADMVERRFYGCGAGG